MFGRGNLQLTLVLNHCRETTLSTIMRWWNLSFKQNWPQLEPPKQEPSSLCSNYKVKINALNAHITSHHTIKTHHIYQNIRQHFSPEESEGWWWWWWFCSSCTNFCFGIFQKILFHYTNRAPIFRSLLCVTVVLVSVSLHHILNSIRILHPQCNTLCLQAACCSFHAWCI